MSETFNESAPTLRFGVVSAIDANRCYVRVTFADLDNLQSDWLPVGVMKSNQDKVYFIPDVGEHVAVLLDANGDAGVVVCAIYSSAEMPPASDPNKFKMQFKDGSVIEYDRSSHAFVLNCVGTVTVQAKGKVSVTTDDSVTVKAAKEVTIKATKVILDAPNTVCLGNLMVQGVITYQSGLMGISVTGGAVTTTFNGNVNMTGTFSLNGSLNATGTIMDSGGNSNHHSHND